MKTGTTLSWSAAVLLGAVWAAASDAGVADPQQGAASTAAMRGSDLTEEGARRLEDGLKAKPDDLEARVELLGYYFLRSHRSEEGRKARQGHILWVIKNHPEAEIAGLPYASLDPVLDGERYHEAHQLWLGQVEAHKQDPRVLRNAARFLTLWDRANAERILMQLQTLEPESPEWPQRLGQLYQLDLGRLEGTARSQAAKTALRHFEQALGSASGDGRGPLVEDAARAALEAGEVEKARAYALELLANLPPPGHWNHGNAVHHGHLLLGRLALRSGDVAAAKKQLLEAGRTPGSPQLDSFGPNMQLAKELLEKGEGDAVLQYFELCSRFWKMGTPQLKDWTATVRGGGIPDFSANLNY